MRSPPPTRLASFLIAGLAWSIAAEALADTPSKNPPRRAGVHWTFRDVAVQTLLERLKRFGVEVPVELSGQVTVRLSAGAPWRSLWRPSAYEVEGDLTSPSLTVAGFELKSLSLHLVYADGALRLTDMKFIVPDKDGRDGTVSGTARMQARPPGDLTAELSLVQLPLATLFDRVHQLSGHASGTASGRFSGRVPVDGIRDPARWQAAGRLTLDDVQAVGLPPGRLTLDLRLARGRAALSNLSATLAQARLSGSADLKLAAPYDFTARLRAAVPDLAWLKNLDAEFAPPVAVDGSFSLSADAVGALEPRRVRARGALTGQQLKVEDIHIDRLRVPFEGTLGRVRLTAIRVDLYGGQVLANLLLPTELAGNVGAGVRVRNVDVGRLAADVLGQRQPWRGLASATAQWQAPAQRLLDPEAWNGQGDFAVGRGNLLGIDVSRVAGNFTLGNGQVRVTSVTVNSALAQLTGNFNYEISEKRATVSQIAGRLGGGTVSGSARLGLAAPYEFGLKLAVANADLSAGNRLATNLRPPVRVGGLMNASADLRGELEPLEVDGGGNFNARNLRFDGARVDSLAFDFSAARDSITVSRLAVVAYAGRVDGTIAIPLAETSQGNLDLRWRRVNFGRMLDQIGKQIGSVASVLPPNLAQAVAESRFEGWTWGHVTAAAPAGKLTDPTNWTGDVDVSLASVRAFGWSMKQAFLRGTLADGRAELTRLAFDLDDTRLRGTASLNLAAPHDFQAKITLDNGHLADVNKLPRSLRPPLKLAGDFNISADASGTLDPLEVTGDGSLTAQAIEAGGAKVDALDVQFTASKDKLELTRFRADLYDGSVHGRAFLALTGEEAGRTAFDWEGIDLGSLLTDMGRLPVRLSGQISGKLGIAVPAGRLADIARWSVHAEFDTSPLLAGSAALGQLSGRLDYERGTLDYNVHGAVLRGTLELAGRWQPSAPPGEQPVNEGRFELAAVQLDALMPLLEARGVSGLLTGQISLRVQYEHDAHSGLPAGTGDVSIDNLTLNGIVLFDELRGVVRLAGEQVELANLSGLFADGSLTGYAVVYLNPARRGTFRIGLSGVELAQLVALSPKAAVPVRGTLDAQLQGFFGGRRPVQVNGAVAVREGRAAGIEFSGLRLPLAGNVDTGGRGVIQLHGASGELAGGRVVGDVDLTLANGLGIKGKGKFTRIDLRTLLHSMASASRLANGKISGLFTLAGRNVRTINELTGTLNATLSDTQAMSLPVLQQTLPYLTGGVSGSTTFDEGTLRANLSRGVVRVERFSLASGSIQIYAQGNVSLAGRLNLNVTAKTGQLNARAQVVAWLAARVALVAAPPVGLLLEATQFLSNQVVNLEVTGTVRSPTIRVKPLELLGQEAARFFLYQGIP